MSLFQLLVFSMEQKQFPSLSEENQILQSENRRLRERLLELYLQINTLSSVSQANGIQLTHSSSNNHISSKKLVGEYQFVQTERSIMPTGAIYSAALNPKADRIALAALNGTVTIITGSLSPVHCIQAHSLSCRDVYWGEVGLISCGFDKFVKIWDVEKQTSQDFNTGGLTHAVCGSESDANTLYAAASDNVFWIDKRRPSPITITADSPATAVTTYNDYIIYGDTEGRIHYLDKRKMDEVFQIFLDGGSGPVSSLTKVISGGRFVVTTAKGKPVLMAESSDSDQPTPTGLAYEAPMRFGCRADITEKNLIITGDFATLCGGRMAAFIDGDGGEPMLFEDVGGFDYGAIFINNIAQKVLTYSEDGVVTIYSLRQS